MNREEGRKVVSFCSSRSQNKANFKVAEYSASLRTACIVYCLLDVIGHSPWSFLGPVLHFFSIG